MGDSQHKAEESRLQKVIQSQQEAEEGLQQQLRAIQTEASGTAASSQLCHEGPGHFNVVTLLASSGKK